MVMTLLITKNINSNYGTMQDFEELLQQAHQLNLKIMMDLIHLTSMNGLMKVVQV